MAKSLYIRPDFESGACTGGWRLDAGHVGRVELVRNPEYDPKSEQDRQIFGTLVWKQYKADGKTLYKHGYETSITMTRYPDGFKQLKSGLLSIGDSNHSFILKYHPPRKEAKLPACFTYRLNSTKKSTQVSEATMEV